MTDHSLNHKNNEFGRFSWPICRLGEIYLNYAEALNEYDPGNDDILKYVNLIRQRAGVPNLEEVYPEEVKDPIQMRQLIRHERQVELAFEGYRFFDTRTWRIAEETENGPVYGMNVMATDHTPTGKFWERTIAETRVFNKSTISSLSHRKNWIGTKQSLKTIYGKQSINFERNETNL